MSNNFTNLSPSRKVQHFCANPWRFNPGDAVWVRNWGQDPNLPSGHIVEQLHGLPMPHYLIQDTHLGGTWQISQLELSGSYLGERK